MESNRDNSVVFEIASIYCISDSVVDYDGYSCMALEWWVHCAGVLAVQCWSNFEEISHLQGQRRRPSKMVGDTKSHLESNTIAIRDTQRAQIYLVGTRTRDPTGTETELCLGVFWGGIGQQWPAVEAGALGAVDLGMA